MGHGNQQAHRGKFFGRAGCGRSALAAWEKVDSVLGIGRRAERKFRRKYFALAEAAQAARKAKDFKKSDAIRDELKAKGWVIEDTPKGMKLKKN